MAVGAAGVFAGRLGHGQGNGGAVLGGEGIEGDRAGIERHIFTCYPADRVNYQPCSRAGHRTGAAPVELAWTCRGNILPVAAVDRAWSCSPWRKSCCTSGPMLSPLSRPPSITTTDCRIIWQTVLVQLRISDHGKIASALCQVQFPRRDHLAS